jgi:hypothetical protein
MQLGLRDLVDPRLRVLLEYAEKRFGTYDLSTQTPTIRPR